MSASVSQMIPTPPESMIFCKIPVPVLLPENINIRLRGISGSSAFAFSRPKELKEVISFLYLFISSATVARISSWIGCTSIRVHASTPFPEAGGATTKVCKLEKNHLPPYRNRSVWASEAPKVVSPPRRSTSRCSRLCPNAMICRNIRGHSCPSGKKGRWVNGSTCSSISVSTLLSHARVWETGAALFALLALLACVSRGRLGGSKRTPASSAKWKAVPRCILWSPLFKALEKSRSAFSLLNFTDREHRVMKPSRPASPQSLAMANAKRTYSQYPGAISTPAERTASTKRDKLSDM